MGNLQVTQPLPTPALMGIGYGYLQVAGTAGFFFFYLHIASFSLGGSNTPMKGELVEAGYYILVNIYYCLVPVNEHECDTMHSCSFTGTKQ
jgi:hypothetical protein